MNISKTINLIGKNTFKHQKYILWFILFLLVISIIIFNRFYTIKDGFIKDGFINNNTNTYLWSPDLIKRFNIFQSTVNENNYQFNLDMLQKQASPQEVEHLLETGYWPWSNESKSEYIEKVWSNPIIKVSPYFDLANAMKVYNERAITELLSWNTKEGQFLLYGGDLGKSNIDVDEIFKVKHNTIQCSTDNNDNSIMKKKVYTGMNLWNGYMNTTITNVSNEDIPKEMPGFSFVKNPCNPCVALNSPGDFSCPFKLNVKGDDSISPVWSKLWGL